jgi:hypothetical protein
MEDAGPAELAPTLPAGLPDGWVFDRDLPCPTCRYNLRMLHTPRCPECGIVFRWQELLRVLCPRCGQSLGDLDSDNCSGCELALNWAALLDDAIPLPGPLYEYSPHPVRAALRTAVAVLMPRRFWRSRPLELPAVPKRLRAYRRKAWSLGIAGLLVGLLFSAAGASPVDWLFMIVIALGLPCLTQLALPRFTLTLTRFRIRREQLQRCFAYGSTGVGWIGLTLLIVHTAALALSWNRLWGAWTTWGWWYAPNLSAFEFADELLTVLKWRFSLSSPVPWLRVLLGGVFWWMAFIWWWRYLYVVLRHYLRLNGIDAVALFLSTQVIACLIVLLAITGLTIMGYHLRLL